MIKVAIKTTGCKVNQAEAEALRGALADLPVRFVAPGQAADVVVVNACAVTRGAERDGRAWVHRSARTGASTMLAGCLATRVSSVGRDGLLPANVRVVPGTGDRTALVAALRDEVERLRPPVPPDLSAALGPDPVAPRTVAGRKDPPLPGRRPRARPVVKVQDGCDGRCSYCIVPLLRGPSRSVPAGDVESEVRAAAAAGAAEIVLAGVDLAAWGRDLGGSDLTTLLARLRDLGTGLRFRLSSVEPHGLTDRLLEAMTGPDVCRHLHVPLQSGSDRVLRAMRRPYRAADLGRRLRDFAATLPGLAIGMDVIVGFPGETDADFRETRDLVESLPVSYLHVFPFSARPGTGAEDLPGAPPPGVVAARSRDLRELSARRRSAHAAARVGHGVEVVDVRARAGGIVESLGSDYTRVFRRDPAGPRSGRFHLLISSSRDADAWAPAHPVVEGP